MAFPELLQRFFEPQSKGERTMSSLRLTAFHPVGASILGLAVLFLVLALFIFFGERLLAG